MRIDKRKQAVLFEKSTMYLVNLPCPKFGDSAFVRICLILIYRSWSYVIRKLKTGERCHCLEFLLIHYIDNLLSILVKHESCIYNPLFE